MLFHENEKCPVCDRFFTADDDIVVCPECATPHHRECYRQLGHCANRDKHNTEFVYKPTENAARQPEKETPISERADTDYSEQENNKTVCKSCGTQINKSAPFCYNCGAKQDFPEYEQATVFADIPYDDDGEKIDGRRVKDIADTVRSNTSRFIKKFRNNKAISWNWGAFFFGPYYLFFRKMYKEGIIAMAISLIASILVRGAYVEQFSAFFSSAAGILPDSFNKLTPEIYAELTALAEPLMPAMMILYAVSFVVNLTITLTADKMYRTKVMSIIDKVNSNENQDSTLMQSPMLQSGMNMSRSQMKAFYLGRMGGTSLLSPLLAYMVLNLISSWILRM